jgi:Glutamine amidotransferase domain
VDKDGKSDILKVLGGAGSLFGNERWQEFQANILKSASVVVGHGRAATRGTVKLENAHPFAKTFETGEILKLVHNGTLEYAQDLPDFHKFDVDSEWIAEMIVRYGPLEALTKIRGAMALVWWNEKDKTINFFRNADRPLHFGRFSTKWENTFILNSEAAAVRYLSERNGLTPLKKDTPVFYFAPRTHYALKIDDLFGNWAVCEEYAAPKPKVTTYDYGSVDWKNYRENRFGDPLGDDDDEVENFFDRQRSYDKDLEALQSGRFKMVEFRKAGDKWDRRTQLENFSSIVQVDCKPYMPGLVRMERTWCSVAGEEAKMWVRMTYEEAPGGKYYYTHVGIKKEEIKQGELIPFGKAPANWRDANFYKEYADVGCQKFSPGRKFRWTSKNGSLMIRHSATVGNDGGPFLKCYKNDHDGTWVGDEEVMIEITSMQTADIEGKRYLEVEGVRVESKVDRCVDVLCYFDIISEEAKFLLDCKDVHSTPFINGKVDHIELAHRERHEDTGAFAVLVLKDMEFVEAEPVETVKETLQ